MHQFLSLCYAFGLEFLMNWSCNRITHWSDSLMLTGPEVQRLKDNLGAWATHSVKTWDKILQKCNSLFLQWNFWGPSALLRFLLHITRGKIYIYILYVWYFYQMLFLVGTKSYKVFCRLQGKGVQDLATWH